MEQLHEKVRRGGGIFSSRLPVPYRRNVSNRALGRVLYYDDDETMLFVELALQDLHFLRGSLFERNSVLLLKIMKKRVVSSC